jgi:hypothetical protein
MNAENRSDKANLKARFFCSVMFVLLICAFLALQAGCTQPGETMAEGHRRHLRNVRANQQELMQDVDAALMTDEPSKLTDKRIK